MSCWHCGSILVSYTRGSRFESFYYHNFLVTEFAEFREKHLGKTPMLTSQADSLLGDMMSIHCYCLEYANAILASNTINKNNDVVDAISTLLSRDVVK